MKIFITGGSGFIGRNLKEQLGDKYQVAAPASSELNLFDEDDIFEYLKKEKFDVVIHAATWNATRNSPRDTTKVLENNLKMFFNLARCRDYYGKMIYYGSGAEYDRRHWAPKMREDYFDTHVPADGYGYSKYVMRKYAEKTENIYNLCLFGVFGKYEDWEIRFISNVCCKVLWDLPITIKQNVLFDYLYIDDLIKISEWFIKNNQGEQTYNICTGMTYDLLTIAKKVLNVSGKDLDIVVKKEGMAPEYSGNNSKLLKQIRDHTFNNIDVSINDLYEWYSMHRNLIDKEKLLTDK